MINKIEINKITSTDNRKCLCFNKKTALSYPS